MTTFQIILFICALSMVLHIISLATYLACCRSWKDFCISPYAIHDRYYNLNWFGQLLIALAELILIPVVYIITTIIVTLCKLSVKR